MEDTACHGDPNNEATALLVLGMLHVPEIYPPGSSRFADAGIALRCVAECNGDESLIDALIEEVTNNKTTRVRHMGASKGLPLHEMEGFWWMDPESNANAGKWIARCTP